MLLSVLLVVVILVGAVVNYSQTMARSSNRSRNYFAAESAAEAAVDWAYSVWYKRIDNKHNLLTLAGDLDMSTCPLSGTSPAAPWNNYITSGTVSLVAVDKYGNPLGAGSTPDQVIGPAPGYPGWWGYTYTYAATATMYPIGSTKPVSVRRLFQYTVVSLFQTMYFFNDDLEIFNPAPITLTGLIHSNKVLYLSASQYSNGSSYLTILGDASASGTVPSGYTADNPPNVPGYTSQEPPLAKTDSDVNSYASSMHPPYWGATGGVTSQVHEVPAIQLFSANITADFPPPLGTGSPSNPDVSGDYGELIQPPSTTGTEPVEIGQMRMFNQAGLIIKINNTIRSGTTTTPPTYLPTDFSIVTGTADSTTGDVTFSSTGSPVTVVAMQGFGLPLSTSPVAYSAAQTKLQAAITRKAATDGTALYDQRQNAYVNVVNVDVNQLARFIYNSGTGNFNGVVYIEDTSTNAGGNINTIRLYNGYNLPNNIDLQALKGPNYTALTLTDGLTVASQDPIYIRGDYNTGTSPPSDGASVSSTSSCTGSDTIPTTAVPYTRLPAAVIGDAVMLLSGTWNMNDSTSSLSTPPTPCNTTYNTALLGGYMPSVTGTFSGGAINYPRYLENWNSTYSVTYYGSMVELFPSHYFTAPFIPPGTTGACYTAPYRYYNYDTNYSHTAPPGSVAGIVLSRGTWMKY